MDPLTNSPSCWLPSASLVSIFERTVFKDDAGPGGVNDCKGVDHPHLTERLLRSGAELFLDRTADLPAWGRVERALGGDIGGRTKVLAPLMRCAPSLTDLCGGGSGSLFDL